MTASITSASAPQPSPLSLPSFRVEEGYVLFFRKRGVIRVFITEERHRAKSSFSHVMVPGTVALMRGDKGIYALKGTSEGAVVTCSLEEVAKDETLGFLQAPVLYPPGAYVQDDALIEVVHGKNLIIYRFHYGQWSHFVYCRPMSPEQANLIRVKDQCLVVKGAEGYYLRRNEQDFRLGAATNYPASEFDINFKANESDLQRQGDVWYSRVDDLIRLWKVETTGNLYPNIYRIKVIRASLPLQKVDYQTLARKVLLVEERVLGVIFMISLVNLQLHQELLSLKIFDYKSRDFLFDLPVIDFNTLIPRTVVVEDGEKGYIRYGNEVREFPVIKQIPPEKDISPFFGILEEKALAWDADRHSYGILSRQKRKLYFWKVGPNMPEYHPREFVTKIPLKKDDVIHEEEPSLDSTYYSVL